MVIRFEYALHVETGLIHVWPDKGSRTRMIGYESDCSRDGWRPLSSWEARPLMGSLTGGTGHMAFMVGAWAGMHPECVHCTVRQLEQAQAEALADPGRQAGKNDAADVTGYMRLRLNALAEELGDGWSYGPVFAGYDGDPTVPVFHGDILAGNLAFPHGGPLRHMWGACGDHRHLYQKPCRRIANLLRRGIGIDPLPDVNRRPYRKPVAGDDRETIRLHAEDVPAKRVECPTAAVRKRAKDR